MRVPRPAASSTARNGVIGTSLPLGFALQDFDELLVLADRIEIGIGARLRSARWVRRDRGAERLERGGDVPRLGRGGRDAIQHVLVLGLLIGRMTEQLERLVELATVVQEHAVVQQLVEGLGLEGRALLQRALAHAQVEPRAFGHVALLGVGGEHGFKVLLRPFVVALAERLHSLLEELDGLRRAAVAYGRLLRVHGVRLRAFSGALPEGARTSKISTRTEVAQKSGPARRFAAWKTPCSIGETSFRSWAIRPTWSVTRSARCRARRARRCSITRTPGPRVAFARGP